MLYKLHTDFEKSGANERRKVRTPVKNLIRAHLDGHHFFAPSKEQAKIILDEWILDEHESSLVRDELLGRYNSFVGPLVEVVETYIVAAIEPASCPDDGNKNIVSLKSLGYYGNLAPTRVLVEDVETDREILDFLRSNLGLDIASCRGPEPHYHHGGGSRAGVVLENLLRHNSAPVVCVVDSDRRHPGDRVGSTASVLKAMKRRLGLRLVDVRILEYKEMENCIPLEVVEPAVRGRGNIHARATNIKAIHDSLDEESRGVFSRYFDLKVGMTLEEYCHLAASGPALAHYASQVVDAGGTASGRKLVRDIKTIPYANAKKKTILVEGIGEGLAKAVADYLSAATRPKKKHIAEAFVRSRHCDDIVLTAKAVSEYVLAPRRLRVL